MNHLQGIDSPEPFVVTLNRTDAIDPAKVLRRMRYHHPVYTHASVAAQRRKAEIQGIDHVWFAGAYWGWGFHEDGMRSAVDVARALGCRLAPIVHATLRRSVQRDGASSQPGVAAWPAPCTKATSCIVASRRTRMPSAIGWRSCTLTWMSWIGCSIRAGCGRPIAAISPNSAAADYLGPVRPAAGRSGAPARADGDRPAADRDRSGCSPTCATAGVIFNPVSFYYCFEDDGCTLDTIVAEITNTPWQERLAYVLPRATATLHGRMLGWDFPKAFHVSPFMPMDRHYDWRFSVPDEDLLVHMDVLRDGSREFDALLQLRRRPLTGGSLARVLWRYPLMTMQVIGAIYWQALRLRLKRNPFHAHPEKSEHS